MVIVRASKVLLFVGSSIPMGMGALGTGILFGQFMIASSRNPKEFDKFYGTCLTSFALIETFTFLSIMLSVSMAIIL